MTDRKRSAQPRGSYRGTAEKRREILDAALVVFGKGGYRSGSIREIAERVGMSAPGLLHHFGSKDALLIEVLRHRENIDGEFIAGQEQVDPANLIRLVIKTVERNVQLRGLAELFGVLSAEATAEDHPAHEYFVQRYEWLRGYIRHGIDHLAAAGDLRPGTDPAVASRSVIAMMDGLQLQWLLNPAVVDLVGDMAVFLRGLVTEECWVRSMGPAPAVEPEAVVEEPLGHGPVRGTTTIQDLARVTGVSIASISRALNDRPGVSAATREAVRRAAKEHGYTGNVLAKALKSGRVGRIAVTLPGVHMEYTGRILAAAAKVLEEHGLSMSVGTTGFGEDVTGVLDRLTRNGCDGALALLPYGQGDMFRRLAEAEYPVVLVDPVVEPGDVLTQVRCDNAGGARLAVEHLLALGHTRIGVVAGEAAYVATRERLHGIRAALTEAGLQLDQMLVRHGRYARVEDGFSAGMSLLSGQNPPTAIFALNDRLAAGVLRAARALDVDVPQRLSIAGFDDEEIAALVTPSLTTVRQSMVQMGETAARLVLEGRTGRVTLPTELMARSSTGPAVPSS